MKKTNKGPYAFHTIGAMNKALGVPEPVHPLIAINNYKDITNDVSDIAKGMVMDFYKISYKMKSSGRIRYGQDYYDFNNGGLSFIAPHQLIAEDDGITECGSLTLLIHPDFFNGYPLAKNIKTYGFFSYNSNETLQLTEKEKDMILGIFSNVQDELHQRLDRFSQDVIISQIELLLTYSNRFYNRQFLTQQVVSNDLLIRMEQLLDEHFAATDILREGLPSVQQFAERLNVSAGYLSDLLRGLTGLTAQQHIHERLIATAKQYLTTTQASVAEIAYRLGFEHPQSFSKLFKQKTNQTPVTYRQSLNG